MKRLALVLTLAALTPLAHAGDDKIDEKKTEQVGERYHAVTEIIFEQVGVQGKLVGPNGDIVMGSPPRLEMSFLRLREDFKPEIKTSVDEIK